ncbi:U3 small nucleolar RNA-associated protein 14-like [Lycium ferocissimum]|uniref:U3 small nucleolar RNA-associated protein 14-like n=1 Tax=Lycium ferocissimum TaxID=112874 RepID=UPI002815A87A|nr:U3 small nucleolar RNA-associated protein 14-like [Lycium ferocissimum]
MAGLKRKSNEGNKQNKARDFKNKKQRGGNNKGKDGKRKGPRLPNAMLKELQIRKRYNESDDEEIGTDDAINDFYEYEEAVAEEETRKNRRFDPVENFQYELPDEFEDENVSSDDEDGDGDEDGRRGDNDEEEEEDDGRHSRLLQDITGLPTDAFDGKKKKNDVIISEAYSESEYNPSRDILDGDGRISIQDLLDPLHGKSDYSKLRKTMSRMEKKSMPIHAPLPKPDQERLDRKAAYGFMQKDVTKWEPHVKRNREAPTIYFDEDKDVGFSTVGAIAAEFEPRTDFEKKIASLFNDHEVVEAHKKDGARLLELNKISVEDVRERQNQLAKMKSLLFRHEMKAKRVKKIKSKVYHRLLKKDRLKLAGTAMETDPEAAKEQAMKQEFKRAEERLTLKHKNSSKWAKRILKRGLDLQDEGTRAAIHEQLNQHALLSRKANNMKDSSGSSSEESSDEDDLDEASDGSDQEAAVKLLKKAKDKTTQVLEGDEELPVSGVLSLPFMVRGLKRRKEAADGKQSLSRDMGIIEKVRRQQRAKNSRNKFSRSILSSAPLLLKTIINEDADSVHESQRLKISKELMGFPRASPKLEIICEQSEMDTDVLFEMAGSPSLTLSYHLDSFSLKHTRMWDCGLVVIEVGWVDPQGRVSTAAYLSAFSYLPIPPMMAM